MFGFESHLSAQGVLLQLQHDALCSSSHLKDDIVVLALNLIGAFYIIKHQVILEHLSAKNCGLNTFSYIRDFLTGRTAYFRIDDKENEPISFGTQDTPEAAVLSPFFNLAMYKLSSTLGIIPGVQHVLYAEDDITIWTSSGSAGDMQDPLNLAAIEVQTYETYCGLQCFPQKPEFVPILVTACQPNYPRLQR